MTQVERYTRAQFEQALPHDKRTGAPLFELLTQDSELVYVIPVRFADGESTNKRIVVRSSINPRTEIADATGQDSIRAWVEYYYTKRSQWYSMSGAQAPHTTREPGWPERLIPKLRDLYRLALDDSLKHRRPVSARSALAQNASTSASQAAHDAARAKLGLSVRPQPAAKKARPNPTPEQVAFFENVAHGTGNVQLRAVAGSGKSTTIEWALEYLPETAHAAIFAFNKPIADAMKDRVPEGVTASTIHSLCYTAAKERFPRLRNRKAIVGSKCYFLLTDPYKDAVKRAKQERDERKIEHAQDELDHLYEVAKHVLDLVSVWKAVRVESADKMTDDKLDSLSNYYGIPTNGDRDFIFEQARRVLAESDAQVEWKIDFDDMIRVVAQGIAPAHTTYTHIMIDEAQDLNHTQIVAVLKFADSKTRVFACGDPNQSIYGFRGADAQAMPHLRDMLDAQIMTLSVTWRCPRSHVALAQKLVPEITAAPNAIEGEIRVESMRTFYATVQQPSLVLCRCNAPMIEPVYALIRQGVKAAIMGKDLGEGLVKLLKKVQKSAKLLDHDLSGILVELAEYARAEIERLESRDQGNSAQLLEDRVETIYALSEDCTTVADFEAKVDQVFDDKRTAVTFSTVHRAKGLEAEYVYILAPELMPHPRAEQDWERAQERNLLYVAWTRSKNTIVFLRSSKTDKAQWALESAHDVESIFARRAQERDELKLAA